MILRSLLPWRYPIRSVYIPVLVVTVKEFRSSSRAHVWEVHTNCRPRAYLFHWPAKYTCVIALPKYKKCQACSCPRVAMVLIAGQKHPSQQLCPMFQASLDERSSRNPSSRNRRGHVCGLLVGHGAFLLLPLTVERSMLASRTAGRNAARGKSAPRACGAAKASTVST